MLTYASLLPSGPGRSTLPSSGPSTAGDQSAALNPPGGRPSWPRLCWQPAVRWRTIVSGLADPRGGVEVGSHEVGLLGGR